MFSYLNYCIYRICKFIGVSIAWWIQAVRTAFASALTGGLMMARATFQFMKDHNVDLQIKANRHEDTMIDEYMAYGFATIGFLFQFTLGFRMPFPFNLLLFPFEAAEVLIRWSVTSLVSK